MKRKQTESIDNLLKYLYFKENKLHNDVVQASDRAFRINLDSVQLLEEIIAKERLALFHEIESDIIKVIGLNRE